MGQNNFDEIRYEYFRDLDVEFQAFKADRLDYWSENEAKRWATAYDIPAVNNGNIKKELVNLQQVSGVMVGFVPNLRRPLFQDPRVRRALNYAFDFESLNRTIFYGQYERINSFFYGLPLAWSGLPQGKELEILDSVRDKVPARSLYQGVREPGRRRSAEGPRQSEKGGRAVPGSRLSTAGHQDARPFGQACHL